MVRASLILLVALTRLSHGYYLPGPQLLYIPDPSKAPFFHISFNPVNYPLIPPINMFFKNSLWNERGKVRNDHNKQFFTPISTFSEAKLDALHIEEMLVWYAIEYKPTSKKWNKKIQRKQQRKSSNGGIVLSVNFPFCLDHVLGLVDVIRVRTIG